MGDGGSNHEVPTAARALLVALALLLAGCPATNSIPCSSDDQCPSGSCRRGACGPQCLEDLECGAGRVCREQKCVAPPECQADADCASGFTCQAGTCRCGSDAACAVNEACLSGACAPRPSCSAEADCAPYGRHCEPTQGTCVLPCGDAIDCAPGANPLVAQLTYQCVQGFCQRQCTTSAQCGANLVCLGGGCAFPTCHTLSDCGAGEYCTSATAGQCLPLIQCTSSAECPVGQGCRGFSSCPPGLTCAIAVCQDNPPCTLDSDCVSVGNPMSCAAGRCAEAVACPTGSCPSGQLCVAGACYASGCRGLSDCPSGQFCEAGACHDVPAASSVVRLALNPTAAALEVGDTVQLTAIGYRADGSSSPVAASDSVLEPGGAPSTIATVDATGLVTASAAGTARIRAALSGSSAAPVEAAISIHRTVSSGRRITVIDAQTRLPLQGVTVVGCDGAVEDGPCPAPVQAVTDASGEALFPGFTQPTASFLASAPQVRGDGLPAYDQVGVTETTAVDLLLPLSANPVHGTAGAVVNLSFAGVRTSGNLLLGFSLASASDPSSLELSTYLGETFQVSIPGSTQKLPLPGSAELSLDLGLGVPLPIKARADVLGEPGLRHLSTFAGRFELTQPGLTSADLLAYTSAMSFGVLPFQQLPALPRIADATDLDNDGLCSDPQKCPNGSEDVPDYGAFPQLASAPAQEQAERTELLLPELPAGLDTAVVSIVASSAEPGLLPVGLGSRAGGPPAADGSRALGSMVVRSGSPSGGVQVGQRGVWVVGVSTAGATGGLTTASGNASGRLVRMDVLPAQVAVPPLLPLLQSSTFTPATRTVSPGQPAWNAAVSAGANLGRLVVTGATTRQVIYFPASGSQTQLRAPDPVAGAPDPASEPGAQWTLSAVALDVPADMLLGLSGENLQQWLDHLTGYTRFDGPLGGVAN